jgi:hypothetical protein
VSKWRPIGTAPKDGSEVLAFSPVLGRIVVVWLDGAWRENKIIGCKLVDGAVPTHWTPMPGLPEALKGALKPGLSAALYKGGPAPYDGLETVQ